MKYILPLILGAALLIGCQPTARKTMREPARIPRALSTSPYPTLKDSIDALLSDSLFPPSSIALKVVSLSTGETLYDLNSDLLLTPASNQKLFTAATALSELGEEYLLSTVVSVDTSACIIYVKGFGDPLLATAGIDSIAGTLHEVLPPDKTWTITGDVSYFDDKYWGKGWMWDDEPDPTAMFITPLSVNGNAIDVRIRPGSVEGAPLVVMIEPATAFVSLQNEGVTVSDSVTEKVDVTRPWQERSNILKITGEMRIGDSETVKTVSVWRPELYALYLLSERLQSLGDRISEERIDTLAPGAFEVMHYSHRLDSVITYMDKESDNLSAENLLKILAAEKRGIPGTGEAGIAVMNEYLISIGIDTTNIAIADGSGVSRYNLTSANVIVQLLQNMYKTQEHFDAFYRSLPVAAGDGSLQNRMKGSPAQGNLRAKTGTLTGVSSLSGYVKTEDEKLLAFAMLMQNYITNAKYYRQVQDRIGIFLSNLDLDGF